MLVKFWSEGKSFSIDLNDMTLSNIKSTKFLGIMVDETLCWDKHVHQLKSKLMANKYLLSMSKNLLNQYSLHSVYYAHIHSHLIYGLSIWGSMLSMKYLNELYAKQKVCVKLITNYLKDQTPIPSSNH